MQKLSILAAIFLSFTVLEHLIPLRKNRNSYPSGLQRLALNLSMAATSALFAKYTSVVLVLWATKYSADHSIGLLTYMNASSWPVALRMVLELLTLDYLIYHWHRANHVIPLLWRFHLPHHLDHRLDASTALRFHFLEIGSSGIFRALCIMALGLSMESVLLFEIIVTAAAIFHHSNIRLPLSFEKFLGMLLITPRRHFIHHLALTTYTNSCYGTVLTLWDWIHGTLRPIPNEEKIPIGVTDDMNSQNFDSNQTLKRDGIRETYLHPFR